MQLLKCRTGPTGLGMKVLILEYLQTAKRWAGLCGSVHLLFQTQRMGCNSQKMGSYQLGLCSAASNKPDIQGLHPGGFLSLRR